MLNIDSFRKMASKPKAIKRTKTTFIKSAGRKTTLEGTATQRSEQAFGLVREALTKQQPACAEDLVPTTKLTVTCVRDKLNSMLASKEITAKPRRRVGRKNKTNYFSLVA